MIARSILCILLVLLPVTSHAQQSDDDTRIGLRDILEFAAIVAVGVLVSVVTELTVSGELSPESVAKDENGRVRRLHEYFRELNWSREPLFVRSPDDPMAYWLLQLQRFTYSHDKLRMEDATWQTVPYTWRHQTGVCRDSATLLADMLSSAEYDARLVVGDLVQFPLRAPGPDTGHAWVVLRCGDTGEEYLLESTLETSDFPMRVPPRTHMAPEYFPAMQVTGNAYLTRHSSDYTSHYTTGWRELPAER